MKPDSAAAILSELPLNEGKDALNQMTQDEKSKILEKMDPKISGRIESVQDNTYWVSDDIWKERAKVYTNMDPAKAANVIAQLPLTQARAIVRAMPSSARTDILSKMDPNLAARLLEM